LGGAWWAGLLGGEWWKLSTVDCRRRLRQSQQQRLGMRRRHSANAAPRRFEAEPPRPYPHRHPRRVKKVRRSGTIRAVERELPAIRRADFHTGLPFLLPCPAACRGTTVFRAQLCRRRNCSRAQGPRVCVAHDVGGADLFEPQLEARDVNGQRLLTIPVGVWSAGYVPRARTRSMRPGRWRDLLEQARGRLGQRPSEVGPSLYYYDPNVDGGQAPTTPSGTSFSCLGTSATRRAWGQETTTRWLASTRWCCGM